MARKRKNRHRQTRKTLLVFGTIVLALGVAIGAANIWTFEGPPLIEPESAETIAKRDDPKNQYFTILEIVSTLPERPGPFISQDKEKHGYLGVHKTIHGSTGDLSKIFRPDGDPELEAYLDEIEAKISQIEAALDTGYFMKPSVSRYAELVWTEDNQRAIALAREIVALGVRADNWQDAHRYFRLAIRYGTCIAAEGTLVECIHTIRSQREIAQHYTKNVLRPAPLSEQSALIDEFEMTSLRSVPLSSLIDYQCRIFDSPQITIYERHQSTEQIREQGFRSRLFFSRYIAQTRSSARKWLPAIHELTSMNYNERSSWKAEHEAEYGAKNELLRLSIPVMDFRDMLATSVKGMYIAVALHTYAEQHGALPETLHSLEIDIADPYQQNGEPFIYRRSGSSDYTLYSVGMGGRNQKDHSGAGLRGIIIHGSEADIAEEYQQILDKS